jgi:hypothetical protein
MSTPPTQLQLHFWQHAPSDVNRQKIQSVILLQESVDWRDGAHPA